MCGDNLIEKLTSAAGRTVLCDGAMGTLLADRSLTVRKCHEMYVRAGAEVITTHTLLTGVQSPDEVEANVRLAREVAGDGKWVMGSTGSSWKDGVEYYRIHFEALVRGGADVLLLETVTGRKVAMDALEAWMTMSGERRPLFVTFSPNHSGKLNNGGDDPAVVARELLEQGVAAVGVNCGSGWRELIAAGRRMADVTGCRIILRPSIMDTVVDSDFPTEMWVAAMAEAVYEGFVAMAGGCCGTTPQYIAALRAQFNEK